MSKYKLVAFLFVLMFIAQEAMDYMDVVFTHYWMSYALWCFYTGLIAYFVFSQSIGFNRLIKVILVVLFVAGFVNRTGSLWKDWHTEREELWKAENIRLIRSEQEGKGVEYYLQETFIGGLVSEKTLMYPIDSCNFSKNIEKTSLLTICSGM